MNGVGGRLFACMAIVTIGSAILYQACNRASTIYFFEMNMLNTIFIEKYQATLVPVFLSLFIYLLNWSTQRALIVENKIIQQKLKLAKSASRLGSRKPSVSYSYATGQNTRRTSFSNFYQDENMAEQARRLDRLLSSIDEQDTIQKPAEEKRIEVSDSPENPKTPPPKFTVEKIPEDRVSDQIIAPRSRLGSLGHRNISETDDNSKDMLDDEDVEEYHDPYQRLIELDPINYCWNCFTFKPSSCPDEGLRPMDMLSELVSIHLPIWGCVVAFYVVLLEMMNIKLPHFFYYHGNILAYAALLGSIACGVIHELHSNWITNNLLSLSSVYVIVSRFQVICYQTGIIFVTGVVAADLFWYFGIDLLSTCLRNQRAPIFVMIPCDLQGKKEVLPSSTFVIPGVFLGLVLKYSSMYDTQLYNNTFYAFTAALVVQLLIDIFRNFKMPGLILPSVTAVLASFALANHRQDLWRFMIKH